MHFVTLLDRNVEIVIRPRDTFHTMGQVSVFFTV
jgi:hypothetical protein